jgi:hypothetical protein
MCLGNIEIANLRNGFSTVRFYESNQALAERFIVNLELGNISCLIVLHQEYATLVTHHREPNTFENPEFTGNWNLRLRKRPTSTAASLVFLRDAHVTSFP